MGLRGLKITVASINLPRPSQKGNLTNAALPYLSKSSGQWLPNKEGEREKEKKRG
jgi:hypothetical protein